MLLGFYSGIYLSFRAANGFKGLTGFQRVLKS